MPKRSRRSRSEAVGTPSSTDCTQAGMVVTLSTLSTQKEEEFLGEPVSQLDLLTPLVHHYMQLIPPSEVTYLNHSGSAASRPHAPGNGSLDGNTTVSRSTRTEGSDTSTITSQQVGGREPAPPYRFEMLKSFAIPNEVVTYLERVPLLPPTQGAEDETGNNERVRGESFEAWGNVNGTSSSAPKGRHAGETETLLVAALRRAMDVRLPPFADDSEFLMAHEMRYIWRRWVEGTSGLVGCNEHVLRMLMTARLDFCQQCRPCQSVVAELYVQHTAIRLQKMARPPRIIRLSNKLSLSQHETAALTYLVICHSGSVWPQKCSKDSTTPGTLASRTGLNPVQLMHFLADYRNHVKQGVIATESKFKTTFMESRVYMPQEVIAALVGDNLPEDQLIKLEKTALADVLTEERATIRAKFAENGVKEGGEGNAAETPVCTNVRKSEKRAGSNNGWGDGDVNDDDDYDDEEMNLHTLSCCSGSRSPRLEAPGTQSAVAPSGSEAPARDLSAVECRGGSHPQANFHSPTTNNTGGLTSPLLAATAREKSAPGGHTDRMDIEEEGAKPYASDIEYMEESFKLIAYTVRLHGAESDMKDEEDAIFVPKNKVEATMRELHGKVRVKTAVHLARTEATLRCGTFLPRAEALSQRLQLSDLEKRILLLMVGNVVSHDVLIAINGRYVMRDGQRVMTVGYILFVLCSTLRERVSARKAFYLSGPLVSNGVLSLSIEGSGRSCFNTDLMDYIVDIDRKIVDYLMGTESETAEMVPGSRLYQPNVSMSSVVLPKSTTDLVLSTIRHYGMFEECKRNCGFGEGLGTGGSGLVFLFYGPSGTGKTMLANAVAHELKKRILLVNMLQFKSEAKGSDVLRFIFREAKLNDALIFFDECETIFEAREANPFVTSLLAEFEKYDGIVVLATNKAQVIDEAMNRRISLMVEFRLPDQQMREGIWRAHIPSALSLHEDVSVRALSLNYEISGGLIRNAVLTALSKAVARERSPSPMLCMQDLEEGARLQLRGFFLASEKPGKTVTASYHTPKRSLSDLVLEPETQQQLEGVARLAKGRTTLFAQWGFKEEDCADNGSLYLFHGPSGSGKSLAAEGIAYECATTIRLCNLAEHMLLDKLEVGTVFSEALTLGAIIVFDQAQVLFNHSQQGAHVAKIIHYHSKQFPRPILFLATVDGSGSSFLDLRSTPLIFQQEIRFSLPTQHLRRILWGRALPENVPVDEKGIDLDELSKLSVSPKLIRAAAFSACCKVATLPAANRLLTMELLREEVENMKLKEMQHHSHNSMFA
ncbi:AAA ATPase, putative [Trypanosoma equiperdum]|uniref:AAA ATPase, putative n=2 Tax=Trypanozoon TaxID=39700 RepID=Q382K0_TRYB2|nr:uncharacterized protein Tb11.01.4940 [Trypanosoma brucei brucei TREU927]EAN80281.1 AAA ATPase, putative [Trypanosoma brucei brucei TREU927]SCU66298.1 AAA ATPase, putative [Trypanosoma equiperdum]